MSLILSSEVRHFGGELSGVGIVWITGGKILFRKHYGENDKVLFKSLLFLYVFLY